MLKKIGNKSIKIVRVLWIGYQELWRSKLQYEKQKNCSNILWVALIWLCVQFLLFKGDNIYYSSYFSNRKAKLFFFYEFTIKLEWGGKYPVSKFLICLNIFHYEMVCNWSDRTLLDFFLQSWLNGLEWFDVAWLWFHLAWCNLTWNEDMWSDVMWFDMTSLHFP